MPPRARKPFTIETDIKPVGPDKENRNIRINRIGVLEKPDGQIVWTCLPDRGDDNVLEGSWGTARRILKLRHELRVGQARPTLVS